MVNFISGDAILPTRIACYCRHHHEKVGFRICFQMRDYRGQVIAKGVSPPIMITDDHKSMKQTQKRKRSRDEETIVGTPDISRRYSIITEDDTPLQTPSSLDESAVSQDLFDIFPQKLQHVLPVPVPRMDRLIPSEGPIHGGIDVTILGSGFYRGLTCLFGDRPATTTIWNENTLVCVLPPATHTGPVVVSFGEHPSMIEDMPIFTYRDASDQGLYELALQVVGIKMTGKLQDPKQVAIQIVQGGTRKTYQQQLLEAMDYNQHLDLTVQNACGHTLLHLAVILGFQLLVKKMIAIYEHRSYAEKLEFLNKQDRNGMTALQFSCQSEEMESILLESGASLESKWLREAPIKKKPVPRRNSGVKNQMMLLLTATRHPNSSTNHCLLLWLPGFIGISIYFVR
jgi:hypothetical protein